MANPTDPNTYSAVSGFAVTPSDATVFASTMRGLYVGTTGNVQVRMLAGQTLVFNSVPAGALLPIEFDMVFNTNTTASNMVALR